MTNFYLAVYADGRDTSTVIGRDRRGRDIYGLAVSIYAYPTRAERDAQAGGRGKSGFRSPAYHSSGTYLIADAVSRREAVKLARGEKNLAESLEYSAYLTGWMTSQGRVFG